MPRGGYRPTAGRKVGSKGRFPRKTRQKPVVVEAAKAGLSPLEFMLKIMRDESQPLALRADMAKSSAPFMHAKVASVVPAPDNNGASAPKTSVNIQILAVPSGTYLSKEEIASLSVHDLPAWAPQLEHDAVEVTVEPATDILN